LNDILQDNRVMTMRDYLRRGLAGRYDDREAGNIIQELFRSFMGWSKSDLIANQHAHISESEMLRFHFALKELKKGKPLQYVLGKAWFRGHEFMVNSSVLIPRPETEELVSLVVLEYQDQNVSILDVGTGSGCIAVSLALELPKAEVSAIDISVEALDVAMQNAVVHEANVRFMQCDILRESPGQRFDVIISNPPYIPETEKQQMPENVTMFEPHLALFTTDNDPLLFYRRLIEERNHLLLSGGQYFFEIHEDYKAALETMLNVYNNIQYTFYRDMQEKWRMLSVSFPFENQV
jgi:release factor glutamine methyltransferase